MNLDAYRAELKQNQALKVDRNFGQSTYVPSNKQDRKPKHERLAIQTYDEYKAYLDKIGL